jgi:hypothetical protein
MGESRVTVNEAAIRAKLEAAAKTKLREVAEHIAKDVRCDEHPDHQVELEVVNDGMNVLFRGTCCDEYKRNLEATLADRFHRMKPRKPAFE